MSEAIVVAIITGVCAIVAQLIISKQSSKDLYAKLDKNSELADAKIESRLEKHQAVTDTKIEELTREVREHNNFARRVPVLEEKVANLERRRMIAMMSNKMYDVLKWIAMYLLPALGTLYFALAGIWGFPYGEQVVGTITAVDTFLGVILGISTAQYNKQQENLED